MAAVAELAVWLAELGPELTLPPAIETGELPFTVVWSLFAPPIAACVVSAFWPPTGPPPPPPQPARQTPLPPTVCSCDWFWFVSAELPTIAAAAELAVWLAELGPELTSPPAIETGALPLTAVWSLSAHPIAAWFVSAFWAPSW